MWIPTRDGTRLAARLWLPDAPGPMPTIFEAHPYRLSDAWAVRDARVYGYLAGHGYACVRVDVRGTGNSEGVLTDEYTPTEQDDNEDVLTWIADQPWSDGRVGAFGISWSGFAALQLAARRPRELRAVVAVCASDDRYTDDVHYRGGCLLGTDMLPWAVTMDALSTLPPDPAVVGDAWEPMWRERLDAWSPFVHRWLDHPTRDDYWRQGSVAGVAGDLDVPLLAVGGWSDGYVDAVPRLVASWGGPARGLIGPWSHGSPEQGVPGPAIGFLQELLRWYDRWLRDRPTGVEDDPPLRVYLQEATDPSTFHGHRDGRWIGVDALGASRFDLAFDTEMARGHPGSMRPGSSFGLDAGTWCPSGLPGDWPSDQRDADDRSVSFTSQPLDRTLEVVGSPTVELDLGAEATGQVVVRLCDVTPDGTSLLVSRQVARVNGDARITLGCCSHRFAAGRRVRVSVAADYFPWMWPTSRRGTMRVHGGRVGLPLVGGHLPAAVVSEPEQAAAPGPEVLTQGTHERRVDGSTLTISSTAPRQRMSDGLELASSSDTRFSIDRDAASPQVSTRTQMSRSRDGWHVDVHATGVLRGRVGALDADGELEATLNGQTVLRRSSMKRFV